MIYTSDSPENGAAETGFADSKASLAITKMPKIELDPRWPYPALVVILYTFILLPAIACLVIYSPILANYSHGRDGYNHGYQFAFIITIGSGTSALHVLISYIAFILSHLAPVASLVLSTLSALAWGTTVGGTKLWWQKHEKGVCDGDWGEEWKCEYAWITLMVACIAAAASFLTLIFSAYVLMTHMRRPKYQNQPLKPPAPAKNPGPRPRPRPRPRPGHTTSIIGLGPPSTPPVNLHFSRAELEIDSLLEQGSMQSFNPPDGQDGQPQRVNLYTTAMARRTEFPVGGTGGGDGKLILAPHLDPTSPGFEPGRLIYASSGPPVGPVVGNKKGKGKMGRRSGVGASTEKVEGSSAAVSNYGAGGSFIAGGVLGGGVNGINRNSQNVVQARTGKSVFEDLMMESSPLHSHRDSQAQLPKPLPPVPIPDADIHPAYRPLSRYGFEHLNDASVHDNDHNHNNDSQEAGPSTYARLPLVMPLPIRMQSLRRISSAPPGSLNPPIVDPAVDPDEDIYYYRPKPAVQTPAAVILKPPRPISQFPSSDTTLLRRFKDLPPIAPIYTGSSGPSTSTGPSTNPPSTTTGRSPGISSPHTPHRSSNLTMSFTFADLDGTGVDSEDTETLSPTSREGTLDRRLNDLLQRVGDELHTRPASPVEMPIGTAHAYGHALSYNHNPPPASVPYVVPIKESKADNPAHTESSTEGGPTLLDDSSEPRQGPIRTDTFSSEESDESSFGIDPEKGELLAQELEEAKRMAERKANNDPPEMIESPQSQPLTLPLRRDIRVVSSPVPAHIPQPNPQLEIQRSIELQSQQRPPVAPGNVIKNRVVSESSPAGRQIVPAATGRSGRERYTTVAPLTITKELPPLPPLLPPPLPRDHPSYITPQPQHSTSSTQPPPPPHPTPVLQIPLPSPRAPPIPQAYPQPPTPTTPTTPKCPRTPIPDLKAECVGHFTVSSTGQVEVSPTDEKRPYRGRIESLSSTSILASTFVAGAVGQTQTALPPAAASPPAPHASPAPSAPSAPPTSPSSIPHPSSTSHPVTQHPTDHPPRGRPQSRDQPQAAPEISNSPPPPPVPPMHPARKRLSQASFAGASTGPSSIGSYDQAIPVLGPVLGPGGLQGGPRRRRSKSGPPAGSHYVRFRLDQNEVYEAGGGVWRSNSGSTAAAEEDDGR